MGAICDGGRRTARGLALVASAMLATVHPVEARASRGSGGVLERLVGSWSGTGVAGPTGSAPERVSCHADFTPAGEAQLHLALRCAGGGYTIAVDGELSRTGDRVGGTFVDRSFGVSGNLAGTVGSDSMRAVISGMGLAAALSLTVHGDVQAVKLQGLGNLAAGASVVLHRA